MHERVLQVVRIDQPHHETPPKMPLKNYNYHRSFITDWRTDLKPWNVDQPEGPSFKVC
jgi:Cu2+-containing amine oxidase